MHNLVAEFFFVSGVGNEKTQKEAEKVIGHFRK
jgi:hypothetical protein